MAEEYRPPERDLAGDWATIWQSELAAIAADPETTLVLHSLMSAWLQAARTCDAAAWQPDRGPKTRSDAASGAAPAGAAAGPRDAEIAEVRRRLSELERRLGAGDRGG